LLQYAWQVKVRNDNTDFEFGFTLFPTSYGKGSFRALLEAGQFDVWRLTKGNGSTVPNAKVDHEVSADAKDLKIIIRDKGILKLLFSGKPKHVICESVLLEKKSLKKVAVDYAL
jgi:hypothetical protein